MNITITTDHPDSRNGIPVTIVDGKIVAPNLGLKTCMKTLGWSTQRFCEATGKSPQSYYKYDCGAVTIPAEVWNVLRDELSKMGGAQ